MLKQEAITWITTLTFCLLTGELRVDFIDYSAQIEYNGVGFVLLYISLDSLVS